MGSYSIRDMSLAKRIDRLRSDILALKSTQGTGRANTVTKTVSTGLIPSIIIPPGDWQGCIFEVTFVAETQKNPYARIGLLFYDSSYIQITDKQKIGGFVNELVIRKDDGQYKWLLVSSTQPGDTAPYYVKIVVSATDNGSITYVRTD